MRLETDPNFPSIPIADERAGDRIGPYRLVHELGAAVGIVYLAIRADDAYQKRVAIKMVKRGMDTDDILQPLSPRKANSGRRSIIINIARLIDGGSTAGRSAVLRDGVHRWPPDSPLLRLPRGSRVKAG